MRFLAIVITLLFLIVGGKLCLTGDRMYEDSQVFPAAEKVDYAKFASERPLVGWYQISGAVIDITEAAYRSAQVNADPESRPADSDYALLHRAREVYVPAHNAANTAGPADIILFSRDPDLIGAVKANSAGQDTPSHVTAPRIIKGMVRAPSELPDSVRRALGSSINTQSIIVEEYASPSTLRALETMGAGGALVISTAMLWLVIWRRDRRAIVIPEEFMPDDLEPEGDT